MPRIDRPNKPRALMICGSVHQTKQMLAIADALPEVDASFTPYYVDGPIELARRAGLIDMTIAGRPWSAMCREVLLAHGRDLDERGARGPYDLVLTAQDAFVPRNVRRSKIVLIQEGMTDPETIAFRLVQRFRFLPRWISSTAAMGLSDAYQRFCIGSEGYRAFFERKGVRPEKLVVTGVPLLDDCRRYLTNDFPYRGYVLVCTSDGRETFKRDDRMAFLQRARAIAGARRMIFKLHPNERIDRAKREILQVAAGSMIFTRGSAEEMVANCAALVCEYSTLAFVGLALGKEVHSHFELEELRALLPLQHGRAARNIATVCRGLLGLGPIGPAATTRGRGNSSREVPS